MEFGWYLNHLSPEAVFRHLVREHPRDVTDPAEVAEITARLRGSKPPQRTDPEG